MASALPYLFLAAAPVAGYLAYRSWQQERRRKQQIRTWAADNGYAYEAENDSWCGRWTGEPFDNGNVRALNTRIEAFPSSMVAWTFKFAKAEYFEVEEPEVRAPVAVDFSSIAQPAGQAGSATTESPQTGQPPA